MIKRLVEPEEDTSEFVDPVPVARLSRRNILALVLSLAGVLLVLFFSSRRSTPEASTSYELAPLPATDAMTLAPVEPRAPRRTPWEPSEAMRPERVNERKSSYDEARHARGVLHVSVPEIESSQPDSMDTIERGQELVLLEGSVIEVALETGIHTGRPGPVRARVTRPVRDSKTLQRLLIPPGTQLIGAMEEVFVGQEPRAIVVWNRMIFPSGETRDLPGLPALDYTGEGGLQDKVKRYRLQRFGNAALLALVGSATTLSTATTAGSLAGGSIALELSRVASGQLERGRGRQPVLILRPGYSFLVYVSKDMTFAAPYEG